MGYHIKYLHEFHKHCVRIYLHFHPITKLELKPKILELLSYFTPVRKQGVLLRNENRKCLQ